jgi:uncharacterized protein
MWNPLLMAADAWLRRYAQPSAAALAAVANKTPAVVVTGGSRGVGLALAHRFAAAGSPLLILARNGDALRTAAAEIESRHGVKAMALVLDIAEPEAWAAIEQALARDGYYCDVLVNNAGIGLSGAFHDNNPDVLERLLRLNVEALTRLMRHALPAMRARARGGILNVASLGGLTPGPYQAAYYASKAFVISLSEAVAHETRGEGVRVSVVAPGPVETGFHNDMGAEGALYRLLLPSSSAEFVARSAYRGFRYGRRVIAPGLISTFASIALRILPHAIAVPMVGRLLYPGPPKAKSTASDA